jgi:P-type Cu+ transporter
VSHQRSLSLDPVEVVRIVLVALAAAASRAGLWKLLLPFDGIALAAVIFGGYPIFREAVTNLLARRMTMELSMTIALVAASAIGEFFTAAVIVLFVLIAEVLEGLTVDRGRAAIRDLLAMLPRVVTVRRGSFTEEVSAADIRRGDLLLVRPGSRIPADGEVAGGNSFVDQ